MSESIHVNKITKIKIFKYTDDDKTKKSCTKIKNVKYKLN